MRRLIAALLLTSALFSATAGFGYKRAITIDRTKCGTDNSTDFPVLVYGTYSWLATTANGGRVQSAAGYDIALFADSNLTTQLKHEVVSYTPATGAIEIWVKVPTLSVSANTVIYIAYGDAAITSPTEDPTAVWDAGYVGVWHFGTAATLSVKNSKTGTNATNSGAAAAAGKIGGAANFADNTDVITTDVTASSASFTVEFWARPSAAHEGYLGRIVDKQPSGGVRDFMLYRNTNPYNFQYQLNVGWSTSSGDWGPANQTALDNVTRHVVWSYNGTSTANDGVMHSDGVLQSVNEAISPSGTRNSNTAPVLIGNRAQLDRGFDGWIDELRLSNVARSSSWAVASRNNQNDPATFYSIGAEAEIPQGLPRLIVISDQ